MRIYILTFFAVLAFGSLDAQDLQEKLATDICECYQNISASESDYQLDDQSRKCRENAIGNQREAIVELAGTDDDRAMFVAGRKAVTSSLSQLISSCPKAASIHQRLIDLNLQGADEIRPEGQLNIEIAKVKQTLEGSNNVRQYHLLSVLHAEKQDYNTALDYVNSALEQVPTNQHFLLMAALLNDKLGQTKAANTALDTLLENSPGYEEGIILQALIK